MSDKLLITIIAVFVLLFVAGIIYLFVISADPDRDEALDLETRQEAAIEDSEVISEIPGETGPNPVVDRGGQNDTSTESIRPEMVCGALEGRVLDMQDRPIANAVVSLYKNMPGTAPMIKRKAVDITAVTDDKGYYLLPAIPVDSGYLVFARADGFAGAEMSGMSVAPDRTIKVADFRLDLGFTILGTVTDNLDNPLGNVEVKAKDLMRELTGMTDADHTLDTLTGPDGRFTLACLSKNQYDITFTAMGYRSLTVSENFMLSRQGDEPREITVKLDPSGMRITGRVADPTGASIAKAVVKAIFSRSQDHAHFTAETLSNKKGNFLLAGFSEGNYILRASARGFFQQAHISAKGGEEGVLITLQPTGAVKGAIRAASGKTPRKYTLAIETYTPTVRVVEQNQDSSQPCGPSPEFTYHNLLPGKYVFLVKADGFAHSLSPETEILSGQTTEGLVVDLVAGGTIKGSIRSGAKPLSGAKVKLMDKFYQPSLPFEEFLVLRPEQGKTTTTDAQGRFKITHVREGEYSLKFEAAGMASKTLKQIQVQEGDTYDVGALKLSAGGRIKGVAYNDKGALSKGTKVTAVSMEAGNRKTVNTDDKGRFEFTNLAPGQYTLNLTLKDFWSALQFDSTVEVYVNENQTSQVEIYTRPMDHKQKPKKD